MLPLEKYRKTVRRPYPPIQTSWLLGGFIKSEYYKPFFPEDYKLDEVVVVDGIFYCSDEQLEQIGEITLREWKNEKSFKKSQELFLNLENNLIKVAKQNNLKEFSEAFQAYQPAILMISYSDSKIEEFIRELFLEKISLEETNTLMDILNTPLQNNIFKKQEFDLAQTNDLESHVEKYAGLISRYGEDKTYTLKMAEDHKKDIDKEKYLENYETEKQKLKEKIKEAKGILGQEWSHMIDVLQFVVFYRTQRADILHLSTFLHIPNLKKIARSYDLSYDEIVFCTINEVLNDEIPDLMEIMKRKEKHAFINENGNVRIVSGNEVDELVNYFKVELDNLSELKGRVAFKGNVKGIAKVIFETKDYPSFDKDEILVTSMTTPDMVPLMRKAKAIVTDEGGITSHAAIISRELKKPCIIGTKFATQVFKTGDMLEVDTKEGIVKIIT